MICVEPGVSDGTVAGGLQAGGSDAGGLTTGGLEAGGPGMRCRLRRCGGGSVVAGEPGA
jgi:hypothetical protein